MEEQRGEDAPIDASSLLVFGRTGATVEVRASDVGGGLLDSTQGDAVLTR